MTNPIFKGSVALGTPAQQGLKGIALYGSYVFVNNSENATFYVVDIANPVAPTQVASITNAVFGTAHYPVTDGDYVYLSSEDGYLIVVDVKVPQSPSIVSSNNVGSMRGITLWGEYIVGVYNRFLRVINVSNPASPVKIGEYEAPDSELYWADAVDIANNRAYCLANHRLTVIDLTTPTNPSLLSCFYDYTKIGGDGGDIKVRDGYAFIADAFKHRLSIFDIQPLTPVYFSHIYDYDALWGNAALELSGPHAYCCADYRNNLTVVDISNLEVPTVVGTLHDDVYLDGAWGIQLSGKYAYISACDIARVTVLEVEAPILKNVSFESVPPGATVKILE